MTYRRSLFIRFSLSFCLLFPASATLAATPEQEKTYAEAMELYSSGDYEASSSLFRHLIDLEGSDPSLNDEYRSATKLWLAQTLRMQGRMEEAAEVVPPRDFLAPPDRRLTKEADMLHDQANEDMQRGDANAYIEKMLRALELEREALGDDSSWAATTMLNIGAAMFFHTDQKKEGLRHVEEAKRIFRKNGDTALLAEALRGEAVIHINIGDYTMAARRYAEADSLYTPFLTPEERVDLKTQAAHALIMIGKQAAARPLINEALAIVADNGLPSTDTAPLGYTFALSAYLDADNGNIDAAMQRGEEALRMLAANGDTSSVYAKIATIAKGCAILAGKPGKKQKEAVKESIAATFLTSADTDHNGAIDGSAYSALIYFIPSAARMEYLGIVLDKVRERMPGSPLELAVTSAALNYMGNDFAMRSADDNDRKSIPLMVADGCRILDSATWNYVGLKMDFYSYAYKTLNNINEWDGAEEIARRMSEMTDAKISDGTPFHYQGKVKLGYIAQKRGDNAKAVQILEQTVAEMERDGNVNDYHYNDAVSTLANFYVAIGNKDAAIAADARLRKSNGTDSSIIDEISAYSHKGDMDAINEILKNNPSTENMTEQDANSLKVISWIYAVVDLMKEGKHKEASDLLNQGMDDPVIFEFVKRDNNLALQLCIMDAQLMMLLDDTEEALDTCIEILVMLPEIESLMPDKKITILTSLAMIFDQNDAPAPLLDTLKETTALATDMIRTNFSFMTPEERTNFWNMYENIFNNILPSAAIKYGDPEFNKLAYNGALLSKGLLLNSERAISDIIANSHDPELISLADEIATLRKEVATETDGKEAADMRRSIVEKERAVMSRSQQITDYTKMMTTTWEDVRNSLAPETAAVEFIRGNLNYSPFYAALVLTPECDAPKLVYLVYEELIENLDKSMMYEYSGVNDLIWKPVEKTAPDASIVFFSPVGSLYKVALESMPDDKGRMASERIRATRLSSTRNIINGGMGIHTPQIKKAAVFGGIDYKSFPDGTAPAPATPSDSNGERVILRAPENLRAGVTPLPGTMHEATAIYSSLSNHDVDAKLATGTNGSETALKALSGEGFGLLHIGTHGFVWDDEEAQDYEFLPFISQPSTSTEDRMLNRSGLFMAGANNTLKGMEISDDSDDGILTAKEIAALDLSDMDLVALSACETGLGEVNGEGVFGLQRGFKKAGAGSILMSLWKVDDDATSMLMTNFYNNLLTSDIKDKYKALEDAKRTVREFKGEINGAIRDFSDPAYWSAFILLDP